MSQYIVIGACGVRENISNTWTAPDIVDSEVEAEEVLIREVEVELQQYMENDNDEVNEFINSRCAVVMSEDDNMLMVRFNDGDGVNYAFRIVEMGG